MEHATNGMVSAVIVVVLSQLFVKVLEVSIFYLPTSFLFFFFFFPHHPISEQKVSVHSSVPLAPAPSVSEVVLSNHPSVMKTLVVALLTAAGTAGVRPETMFGNEAVVA